MQERPPVCVIDCKSLYDHRSAVGSPSTLHDKRSAIDVLIIREFMKRTRCMIRWAPTGLQLAGGLTKDKGEAADCLRQSLKSGSYVLRCEEQVLQEECRRCQQARRVQRQRNIDMTAGKPALVDRCVVLFPGHGCSYLFIFQFVTSVDFNTVQVANMAQRHSFVIEDRHKSYFNVRRSFRRMEAHSTCSSEKKSGRLIIEMSLTFLLSFTISSSQRSS